MIPAYSMTIHKSQAQNTQQNYHWSGHVTWSSWSRIGLRSTISSLTTWRFTDRSGFWLRSSSSETINSSARRAEEIRQNRKKHCEMLSVNYLEQNFFNTNIIFALITQLYNIYCTLHVRFFFYSISYSINL